MGYVALKFLGKEFHVSEAVKDFLHYDQLLNPVRAKTLQMLSQDMKSDATKLTFSSSTTYHLQGRTAAYQKIMEECADVLVNELFARGVYDVTVNGLLSQIPYIQKLDKLVEDTMTTVLHEGERYSEMQNRGIEHAYRSAASNITGSGVTIFTSSITTLMLSSAVEYGILSHQAKQADKEYDEAVRAIRRSTIHAIDKMTCEVVIKQFYPSLMQILMDFMNKIMPLFLYELASRGKFDFESMENNSLTKAEQMLTNISRVPNKVEFLQQVFVTCPYYFELYEVCLNHGLLDSETFQSAKYFDLADALVEKMNEYIQLNVQNKDKIKPIISILANHQNVEAVVIWKRVYNKTIKIIENTYKLFKAALTNKQTLDKVIRQYIGTKTKQVAVLQDDSVRRILLTKLNSLLTEDVFAELSELKVLSIEDIRLEASQAITLEESNAEIVCALVAVIMEYIEEANRRWQRYEESRNQMNCYIADMKAQIQQLTVQKENLGFFAFSKKKELAQAIEEKTKQITVYQNTHESHSLLADFERMYS